MFGVKHPFYHHICRWNNVNNKGHSDLCVRGATDTAYIAQTTLFSYYPHYAFAAKHSSYSFLNTAFPMALGATMLRDSTFGDQSINVKSFRSTPVLAIRPTLMNQASLGLGAATPKSE